VTAAALAHVSEYSHAAERPTNPAVVIVLLVILLVIVTGQTGGGGGD
jgi:hypothetical protein